MENLLLKKTTLKEETRTFLCTQKLFFSRANKADFLFAYTRRRLQARQHTRAKMYNGDRERSVFPRRNHLAICLRRTEPECFLNCQVHGTQYFMRQGTCANLRGRKPPSHRRLWDALNRSHGKSIEFAYYLGSARTSLCARAGADFLPSCLSKRLLGPDIQEPRDIQNPPPESLSRMRSPPSRP